MPSPPGLLRGLVHHLICLLSSHLEKGKCGASASPLKKNTLKNKVPYSRGERSQKPHYSYWLQIWQTTVAD